MPQFPFVAISPSVTAQALRQRSPFLFLTVVTVASYTNAPIQRRLAKEVIESISANLICGGFSSIDMLQGLLVFLAWFVMSCKAVGDNSVWVIVDLYNAGASIILARGGTRSSCNWLLASSQT